MEILKIAKSISLFSIIIIAISLLSIRAERKPAVKTILDGQWEDVSPATYLGGERNSYKFELDSFQTKSYVYSDVGMCVCNGWFDCNLYSKGIFNLRNDTIFFEVLQTDSTYLSPIKADCFPKGIFRANNRFLVRNDTLLIFNKHFFEDDGKIPEDFLKKFENRFVTYLKRKACP